MQNTIFNSNQSRFIELAALLSAGCDPEFDFASEELEREFQELRMMIATNQTRVSLTKVQRSVRMSLIRSRNTKPELVVRGLVHRMGFRFSLHRRNLPGSPDIVLTRYRCAIFVHGCFWHRHCCNVGNHTPKTRVRFWQTKLDGNRIRDRKNAAKLRRQGWRVLTIWECQVRNTNRIKQRIVRFLLSRKTAISVSQRKRLGH